MIALQWAVLATTTSNWLICRLVYIKIYTRSQQLNRPNWRAMCVLINWLHRSDSKVGSWTFQNDYRLRGVVIDCQSKFSIFFNKNWLHVCLWAVKLCWVIVLSENNWVKGQNCVRPLTVRLCVCRWNRISWHQQEGRQPSVRRQLRMLGACLSQLFLRLRSFLKCHQFAPFTWRALLISFRFIHLAILGALVPFLM